MLKKRYDIFLKVIKNQRSWSIDPLDKNNYFISLNVCTVYVHCYNIKLLLNNDNHCYNRID